ncbi:ATP-binding protein [Almyronema epifaneia]|uniref:ATP-binding protein n=1 Tax=Almyronema epifaneia S1 TaxID=2991925 RepID=A0ABW6ICF1_9CYAN
MTTRRDIVPAHLAVKAMRDNGYKNAAYAIAELMDNAVQAGATRIELLCGEKEIQLSQRKRSRIHQVAVLDNGSGMDSETLQLALQFGNGLYLDESKHTGIGRFGMGLPSSSISQCRKVEVWTWQDGIENCLYSFLDLDQIENQDMSEVPVPESKNFPQAWSQVCSGVSTSGTLIVWSELDKCMWKTANTIIDNSEFLIGRIYRKFLISQDSLSIRLCGFKFNNIAEPFVDREVQPNDPGYLMDKTSCPAPYDNKAMFEKWGDENYELSHTISFRGKEHIVKTRFSLAKIEARQGAQPGATPHGKHAAKNIGVSIVRADRELELEDAWVVQYDARERWWGVEVEFPPSLDELFGVTNNKQTARNFSELADVDFNTLLKGGKTVTQLKEEFEEDEDPRAPLLETAYRITTNLNTIRKNLLAQRSNDSRARKQRHNPTLSAEARATEITNKLKDEEGLRGKSDEDENLPPDERKSAIEDAFIEDGVEKESAKELAATTVKDGLKYVFANANMSTPAFFTVKTKGGSIEILLNDSHPAYENLMGVLEKDVEGVEEDELRSRLADSLNGLKLLLMAWARYEDQQPDGVLKERAQDTRTDWGKLARWFLRQEE